MTLSIPNQRDPIARAALLLMVAGVIYALFATMNGSSTPDVQAQGTIILDATATPALPRPSPERLALGFAVATPTPAPGWLDQQLAAASDAANGFAQGQADQLAQEQAAAQAAYDQAARDQYLANVGAQASHSPRGDVSQPPPSQTGPILYPATDDQPAYISVPGVDLPVAPAQPQIAVAVPHISDAQADVLSQRDSNGCAPGQVFYPRTGCHTPGSGGPQPGAVGTP